MYSIVVQLSQEDQMSEQVSYSYARQNLARILRVAEERQEPVIITRRGHEDMALIPADELRSLEESAHLLRSPKNARRLLHALQNALQNEGDADSPASLRRELGLE
jgi:antitoxin YefM